MALPSNVTKGTVKGRLLSSTGKPHGGKLVFTATPTRWLNVTSTPKTTILPDPEVAVVDPLTGDYEHELIATDNDSLNPKDWTWRVQHVLTGGRVVDSFHIKVPTGAVVDLADVAPVSASNGVPLLRGAGVPEWAGQPDGRTLVIEGGAPAWGGGAPTKKVVPHQVTGVLTSSAYPIEISSQQQGTARYPVKLAAAVSRFRVHVRNYSYADAAGFAGAVDLTGLWWGKGRYNINSELDGGFQSAPTQISGAARLNGTSEWVSGWINVDAEAGADYLLSLGWTTPGSGAPTRLVSNWTRHWRSSTAANASQQAPTLTSGQGPGAPFDVWLECEIPVDVPVVALVGDSISVGDMHEQSYPRRYALAHRVWPVVFGHFGGSLNDWGAGSLDRWTRYGTIRADAALLLCGINDVLADATTNDLKNRTNAVLSRMRTYLGSRVFVSTLLPVNAAGMTTAREAIRTSHNGWLTYMRSGIHGTFDLARAVVSPSNPAQMVGAYTWDGTHLSVDGAVQVAAAIPHLT